VSEGKIKEKKKDYPILTNINIARTIAGVSRKRGASLFSASQSFGSGPNNLSVMSTDPAAGIYSGQSIGFLVLIIIKKKIKKKNKICK